MTIRVLVADDQALVRAGFRGIVDAADGFTVVGEAATGAEAVELARRTAPDVVLMDIRMPGTDGLAATRQIVASQASSSSVGEVKVLILTTYDIDDYVYTALRAGASGFLLKDTPPEELLAAIRVVAAGDALLAPSITRRLIREFVARPATRVCEDPDTAAQLATITEREREVLTLIGQGLTNSEIAERLFITTGTVKTHVGHLLAKSAARDRVHLVILAHRAGLVG